MGCFAEFTKTSKTYLVDAARQNVSRARSHDPRRVFHDLVQDLECVALHLGIDVREAAAEVSADGRFVRLQMGDGSLKRGS